MIEVTMFKSEHSGDVFETQHAARTQIEKRYNIEAQQIADEWMDQGSGRQGATLWLKQNLDRFVRLKSMRDDIQLRDTTQP